MTFTLEIANRGPSTASAVQVTDTLTADFALREVTSTRGTCTAAVVCELGSLAPGEGATVTIVATVQDGAASSTATNTATVQDTGTSSDPVPGNDTASVDIDVPPSSDLQLTKSVSPADPQAGGPVTFTIPVTNAGPSVANNVIVTDAIPPEIVFGSVTGTFAGGTCSPNAVSRVIRCERALLDPGQTATITIQATLTSDSRGKTVLNSVQAISDSVDPQPELARDTVAFVPIPAVDLELTKVALDPPARPGGIARFGIQVANHGPSDAPDVIVRDSLPPGLTFVSDTRGACSAQGAEITCLLGELAERGRHRRLADRRPGRSIAGRADGPQRREHRLRALRPCPAAGRADSVQQRRRRGFGGRPDGRPAHHQDRHPGHGGRGRRGRLRDPRDQRRSRRGDRCPGRGRDPGRARGALRHRHTGQLRHRRSNHLRPRHAVAGRHGGGSRDRRSRQPIAPGQPSSTPRRRPPPRSTSTRRTTEHPRACRSSRRPSGALSQSPPECLTNTLRLVDVAAGPTRVQLAGETATANVGRTVTLLFRGRRVGTAVVTTNGTFAASLPLPPRDVRTTNRARYEAVLGPLRSLNLKLARRMRATELSSRAGTVTIAGRVTSPLARPVQTVTLRQYKDCKGTAFTVVKRNIKVSRDGRFRATVAAPKDRDVAYYRALTRVRKTTRNPKTYETFTLIRGVVLTP